MTGLLLEKVNVLTHQQFPRHSAQKGAGQGRKMAGSESILGVELMAKIPREQRKKGSRVEVVITQGPFISFPVLIFKVPQTAGFHGGGGRAEDALGSGLFSA